MATTSGVYTAGLISSVKSETNWDWKSGAPRRYKALLMMTSYTLQKETDADLADISAFDLDTAVTVTNIANPALDAAGDRVEMDGDDVTFTAVAAGNTNNGVVIYNDDDANDGLLCFNTYGASNGVATNGSDIQVTFDANGIWYVSY